jgi:hypothetical protein
MFLIWKQDIPNVGVHVKYNTEQTVADVHHIFLCYDFLQVSEKRHTLAAENQDTDI